jgi:DNA polymerase III subunit chi
VTEIFFYHLERQPLEKVLPTLLEKTLERDWTAIVQSTTQDRVEMIDELLWTYTAESFLPHAKDSEFDPEIDPIVITASTGLAYSAEVLFLVDGAKVPQGVDQFERIVLLFDGNDEAALSEAREAWKDLRARGLNGTYWQQNDQGRWEKKA